MKPPLARLFKAAAALADLSLQDLAIRTGIPYSRLSRIQTGLHPSRDEARTILRATGVEPDALIKQLEKRSGGRLVSAERLLPLLLVLKVEPTPTVTMEHTAISCDRLSMTFDVKQRHRRDFRALVRRGEERPYKRYRHSYRFENITAQHDPRSDHSRWARLDFNPNKLGRSDWSFLVEGCALAERDTVNITRLDVAVDLPVSLRDVQGLGTGRRKKFTTVMGPSGVQTMYLGSKRSAQRIVIYDKRQELIDTGMADESYPRTTRFEARLKNPDVALLGLAELSNPFSQLRLFSLRSDGLPVEKRLLVRYARFVGLAALQAELAPERFSTLLEDLRTSDRAIIAHHPEIIFATHWPSTAQRLLERLGLVTTKKKRRRRGPR